MPCNCKKNKVKQDLDALKQKAKELEKLLEELKAKNNPS